MNSLKELTDFLKTRDNGASFSELREVFQNEDEIKQFVKAGISNEVMFTTGLKRGTRYYAKGKVPHKSVEKPTPKQEDYESDLEITTDMNVYLQSDKPISGQAVISDIACFGEKDTNNIKKFLMSGVSNRSHYIEWDKALKRNVVVQVIEHKIYNKISIRNEGRSNFVFEKVYAKDAKKETRTFGDYEEMREFLRGNLQ